MGETHLSSWAVAAVDIAVGVCGVLVVVVVGRHQRRVALGAEMECGVTWLSRVTEV